LRDRKIKNHAWKIAWPILAPFGGITRIRFKGFVYDVSAIRLPRSYIKSRIRPKVSTSTSNPPTLKASAWPALTCLAVGRRGDRRRNAQRSTPNSEKLDGPPSAKKSVQLRRTRSA
jgi:hypothetical protein